MSSSRADLTERISAAMRVVIASSVLTNERIARSVGINVVDSQTLSVIAEHGSPMTAGEVSAATDLPTSTTTRVLDRLEKAGFIQRTADPADRRKVVVSPTPKMMEVMSEPYGQILQQLAALHENFTAAELETVARYLESKVGVGRWGADERP